MIVKMFSLKFPTKDGTLFTLLFYMFFLNLTFRRFIPGIQIVTVLIFSQLW